MAGRAVSQKSIVALKHVLEVFIAIRLNIAEVLYENNFPDWFIMQANNRHAWNWMSVLMDLRRGTFFFDRDGIGRTRCIVPLDVGLHSEADAALLGEFYIQKLAAFAIALAPSSRESLLLSESLLRSLQLDGFDVDKVNLELVPLEGAVSAQEEEGRLTSLVNRSGVPQSRVVLKHIEDAQSLYADGKDHASLNESRNLIQALIDGISSETNTHGGHSTKLPGGTGPRIEYLTKVGFFVPDEEAAFKSGWSSLSAGSHPGVPEREQARIGLVLGLEFGQLLLLKFTNWRANGYKAFS
jgi:hypothetical protein